MLFVNECNTDIMSCVLMYYKVICECNMDDHMIIIILVMRSIYYIERITKIIMGRHLLR